MENKDKEKSEPKQETTDMKEETNTPDVSPETAFIVSKVVEAINSIGANIVEYKKAETKVNLIPVMLAMLVVIVVAVLIVLNKLTSEATGFLLGSIVTGTFAVVSDVWRKSK